MPTDYGFDPDLPPDIQAQARALQRRQAVLDAITAQAMQSNPTQMAGRIAIRQSPLEGVARVVSAYMAGRGNKQLEKEYGELGGKYSQAKQAEYAKYFQTPPIVPQSPGLPPTAPGQTPPIVPAQPDLDARRASMASALQSWDPSVREWAKLELQRLGKLETHLTPSGSTALTEAGRNARFGQVGAATQAQIDAANARHATPSGSAALSYQGAMERHATPSGSAVLGRIPQGYIQTETGLAPIPGGPEDPATIGASESAKATARGQAENALNRPKLQQKTELAIRSADSVIGQIDKAMGEVDGTTAGLVGKTLSNVPQTPAYNLSKIVDTVKANIGFDRLQAMRDASPTGGALGQVAIQELVALQNSIASLDQGQSPKQLRDNLARVKSHYENWKRTVMQAAAQQGLDTTPTGSPTVIDFNELP